VHALQDELKKKENECEYLMDQFKSKEQEASSNGKNFKKASEIVKGLSNSRLMNRNSE
jgi:hypothetical protein